MWNCLWLISAPSLPCFLLVLSEVLLPWFWPPQAPSQHPHLSYLGSSVTSSIFPNSPLPLPLPLPFPCPYPHLTSSSSALNSPFLLFYLFLKIKLSNYLTHTCFIYQTITDRKAEPVYCALTLVLNFWLNKQINNFVWALTLCPALEQYILYLSFSHQILGQVVFYSFYTSRKWSVWGDK